MNLQKIKTSLASWETPFVELAIFGTADPESLARCIQNFCQENFSCSIKEFILWTASIGVAAGVQLEDGRNILLKCHQPNVPLEKLQAIERVREFLREKQFPGPKVLLPTKPLAKGFVTVEEFVEVPRAVDGFIPTNRSILAQGLAHMVNLLDGQTENFGHYLLPKKKDSLWPTPHSKLFDFEATKEGAEWIDALATRAKKIIDNTSDDKVIAHFDWRVEHVRLHGTQIKTVFDWDSLCYDRESAAIGSAAVHWGADWSSFAPTERKVPTVEESNQFIDDYLSNRQKKLSREALRAVGAYRLYCLAYTARCGHSLDKTIHPGSAAEALQRFGEAFLQVPQ